MDIRLRISLICGIIIYFVCIFLLLKNKHLALKYSLLWIAGGGMMVAVVAFPGIFMKLMNLIGIIEPTNGIFAIMLFSLMMILVSLTSAISQINNKMRTLAQKCALVEKRLRELESKQENSDYE